MVDLERGLLVMEVFFLAIGINHWRWLPWKGLGSNSTNYNYNQKVDLTSRKPDIPITCDLARVNTSQSHPKWIFYPRSFLPFEVLNLMELYKVTIYFSIISFVSYWSQWNCTKFNIFFKSVLYNRETNPYPNIKSTKRDDI